jgi:hypothetical protein
VNRVGISCDECQIFRANLLNLDLCEQSNGRQKSPGVFIWYPSSRKNHLFEGNKYICHEIVVIHFDIIYESVDNIEAALISYDCKHHLFALNIKSRLCDHIISRRSLHAT